MATWRTWFLLCTLAIGVRELCADWSCGVVQGGAAKAATTLRAADVNFYRGFSGPVKALVLFGRQSSQSPFSHPSLVLKDRAGNYTEYAANLFVDSHPGSISHYFRAMSNGVLNIVPGPAGIKEISKWYVAPMTDYIDTRAELYDFVEQIIVEANNDPARTWNWSDYDANGDGEVDIVLVYYPAEIGASVGFNGTILNRYITVQGGMHVGQMVLSDVRRSFPYLVGNAAHEYGHVMDLPELFDRTHQDSAGVAYYERHAAGLGAWELMARGAGVGWADAYGLGYEMGPNPLCAWSKLYLGWVSVSNGRVIDVTALSHVSMADANDPVTGRVYRLTRGEIPQFLCVDRGVRSLSLPWWECRLRVEVID